ncbi:hypothetical protein FOA52_015047 [Chlamydomonas sp. UWO 241]|nr:hypothetical protein FOA52_015047 [Chlamydomonas sp. UWO 241]
MSPPARRMHASQLCLVSLVVLGLMTSSGRAQLQPLTGPLTGLPVPGSQLATDFANLAAPATLGAIVDSTMLGPAAVTALGNVAATQGAAAVALMAAFETQANTLKALTADVLKTQASIQDAIRSDVTDRALSLAFTPVDLIRSDAQAVQDILNRQAAASGAAIAGLAGFAGDAFGGVAPVVATAANFAAAVRDAPAAVAVNVLKGSAAATASLQGLIPELAPLLPGGPVIENAMGLFSDGLGRAALTYNDVAGLIEGWPGMQVATIDAANAVTSAFGDLGRGGLIGLNNLDTLVPPITALLGPTAEAGPDGLDLRKGLAELFGLSSLLAA